MWILQGCFFRGPIGRQQGTAQRDVRRENYRQKGVEGQRRLSGQRDQSFAKVTIMCFIFILSIIIIGHRRFSVLPAILKSCY